jgi:brefeldin A-resistance guanine nucleotide exchange factor 1
MMNELDVVPISLVEMDDFVDSRGVPLPTGSSPSSSSTPAMTINSPNANANANANATVVGNTGVSGKTRERSRRVAERQAAIRSRMRNMSSSNHSGTSYSSSGPSSGSLWNSLSSYLWAEEEKNDETFDLMNKALKEHVIKLGGGLLEKENWLRMGRKLNEQSLISLLETLLNCRDPFKRSSVSIVTSSSTLLPPADQMMQENAMLVLELSVDLILVNAHRILGLDLWLQFDAYARRLLTTPLKEIPMQLLVERVVVHILRVSIRLFHDEKLRMQVMKTLKILLEMEEDMYKILSDRIACGINMLFKANLVYMQNFNEWNVLLGILENVVPFKNGRAACWESVKLLAEGGHLNQENVTLWIAICLRFVSCRTPYSVDALRLLQGLASNDSVYKMEGTWLEVMRVMLSYLNDDRATIAKTAWDCLYKSLLLPGVPVPPETWKKCFEEVIFAFDDQVKEGIWRNTKEAPLYSITLLSKSFLHNVQALLELTDFRDLWLNVLTRLAMKVAPTSGSGAASGSNCPPISSPSHGAMIVFETTLQSMYNLLLVLKAEKILDPSSEIKSPLNGRNLYEETCEIIERICPHLKEQLGLVEEQPPAPTPTPTPAPTTEAEASITIDSQSNDKSIDQSSSSIVEEKEAQVSTSPLEEVPPRVLVPVAPSSAPMEFMRPSPIITNMNEPQERLAISSNGMETIAIAKVQEIIVDEITEAV